MTIYLCQMQTFDRMPPDLFSNFMQRHVGAMPVAQQLAVSLVSKRFANVAARRCTALQTFRNTAPLYRRDAQKKAACEAIRLLGAASLGLVCWLHERLQFEPHEDWCVAAAQGPSCNVQAGRLTDCVSWFLCSWHHWAACVVAVGRSAMRLAAA
jgi:hypothetical protein